MNDSEFDLFNFYLLPSSTDVEHTPATVLPVLPTPELTPAAGSTQSLPQDVPMIHYGPKRHGIVQTTYDVNENTVPHHIQHFQPKGLFNQNNLCQYCLAYRFEKETIGFCCKQGKVDLPSLPDLPEYIRTLFDQQSFLNNIRAYNNAMALASIGVNEERLPGYSPTFKVHGKVYHYIGSLLPDSPASPKFAQLYFYDATEDQQAHQRCTNSPTHLTPTMLKGLQETLRTSNPYIASMKSVIELPNLSSKKLILSTKNKPSAGHNRKYNLPQTNEIAVLQLNESCNTTDIILHLRGGGLTRIYDIHRSYDPLHYIIMFPRGADGYHDDMKLQNDKRMSPTNYYCYRLQTRKDQFNTISKCRRLMQQYAVDAFSKAERQRLRWARNNQKVLRAEKYKCLIDAVNRQDNVRNLGKVIVLPPTIYGSPRWYAQQYQDAMALMRTYGKPDYFITFTCNPKWQEIIDSIHPGEKPQDRPDICNRAFNNRLRFFLDDLFKLDILGNIVAYTLMTEFQKRGLPHVHIVAILAKEDKPRNPADIDKIVCAEIPVASDNPRLHNIITTCMIHGPCGHHDISAPCMKTDKGLIKCDKHFPKPLRSHTIMSPDTGAIYRRRSPVEGGQTATVKRRTTTHTVDNTFVVPYNPILTLKYNAHINIEIVTTIKAVKYIYKYITKGNDRVMVKLPSGEDAHDEIESFANARYISASEAIWRLYEFPLTRRHPAVKKLPIHLEHDQMGYFNPDDSNGLQNAINKSEKTMLTAFFDLNSKTASDLIYPNIVSRYIYTNHVWQPRKRHTSRNDHLCDTIGRLPVINLNAHQKELYFLRILLLHILNPTSFIDLRTVSGITYDTNHAACVALGLYEDDSEIDKAMEEAASIQFGNTIRQVFATILLYIVPCNPNQFFNRHVQILTEDFQRRDHTTTPTQSQINEALTLINHVLQRGGKSLEHFNLPTPDPETNAASQVIREETTYENSQLKMILDSNLPLLNKPQRDVYNSVVDSTVNRKGTLFHLDAPGGTGKTFTINLILAEIRRRGLIALAVATSGIAATLLPNGRTIHSRFKVPLKVNDNSTCNISIQSPLACLIKDTSLIVIDEVTMANKHVFETVDRTVRDIRSNDKPFGGITLLLAGDWRQILPVIPKGGKAEILQATLKTSYLWKSIQSLKLTDNLRVIHSYGNVDQLRQFSHLLLSIGEGTKEEIDKDTIALPDHFFSTATSLQQFCQEIFPGITKNISHTTLCSNAIICPTNENVTKVNDCLINLFPGPVTTYLSYDSVQDEAEHQYPTEFLNDLFLPSLPPHKLILKPGIPVMLLRNIDPKNGHCNGARYIVKTLLDRVIHASIAMGPHKGKNLLIPRFKLSPDDPTLPFVLTRKQFPIRVCFSITSNKSQGQTLNRIGIFLDQQFFTHGQLYVSLSRVGHPDNIKIYNPHAVIRNQVSNIVYKEVL
ncbi:uncharacterized protein [Antedon mediterranea]|uniref:uncharacterized protein n=1 Tax=Antedon mediterranea TaxID=105859 RepID=UPI003AF5E394